MAALEDWHWVVVDLDDNSRGRAIPRKGPPALQKGNDRIPHSGRWVPSGSSGFSASSESVCVAKSHLATRNKVAAVATASPERKSTRKVKLIETKWAVNEGADEIDMVISRGHFLSRWIQLRVWWNRCRKEVCGDAHPKGFSKQVKLSTLW